MLIDYLRYVAFGERVRSFLTEGLQSITDPAKVSGVHVRYPATYVRMMEKRMPQWWWAWHHHLPATEWLCEAMGIMPLSSPTNRYKSGGTPPVRTYSEQDPVPIEIIIDVPPGEWRDTGQRDHQWGEYAVILRPAAAAVGHSGSARRRIAPSDRPHNFGTLCGFLTSMSGKRLGLTCGHVAPLSVELAVGGARQWPFSLWSDSRVKARTLYREICEAPIRTGGITSRMDAALVELDRSHNGADPFDADNGAPQPIVTLVQDAPVQFRGCRDRNPNRARIAAVTVRKTIDLFRDGSAYEIGDVLMLGHGEHMYSARRVSARGDSGAAVRPVRPDGSESHAWLGMLIGGDDTGAFASYAEHLWSWASEATGEAIESFDFA